MSASGNAGLAIEKHARRSFRSIAHAAKIETAMREFTTCVTIAATPAHVWEVLADVERWPEWTQSVLRIEKLDAVPIAVGSKVRIRQPKLRPAIWTVTAWEPGKRFVWISRNPGVAITAEHSIAPSTDGCVVALDLQLTGILAPAIAWLTHSMTRRYLAMEAAGLKQRSERPA